MRQGRDGGDEDMKRGVTNHPKFRRLKRRLGVPTYCVAGILESLWAFTSEFAEDGDLSRFEPADLADYLEYEGDPVALVEALVAERWLDRKGKRLVVHDWEDHLPDYLRDRARKRRSRNDLREPEAPEQDDVSADIPGQSCDGPVPVLSCLVLPSPTQPSQAKAEETPAASASPSLALLEAKPPFCPTKDDAEAERLALLAPGTEKPKGGRKPVTEQAGIVGDLARAWSEAYASDAVTKPAPTWGGEAAAVVKLAKNDGADVVLGAFGCYLACGEPFFAGHPLTKFVSRGSYDRFRTEFLRLKPGGISRLSPKGRRTAENAQALAAELRAQG
jgi:hypothetical protein